LKSGHTAKQPENQLGHCIARDIAAQIAQIQPDALPLQAFQCVRGVGDISKRPVQLDGDDGVTGLLRLQAF
jgi:hypothetical protein